MTNLLVQHNVPLAVADHLSPLFSDIFPDSKIAKGYAAARMKTTCILNGSIAPYFKVTLIDVMKSRPFSIAIDGSNDSGLEKINPLTVRFFDEQRVLVVTQLLDMCLTTGVDSGTAQSIFSKMDEVITSNGVSWSHCVGVGVDNTSVNLGVRNCIRTHVLQCNPNTYFIGCPCYIVHNAALKASEIFAQGSFNFYIF
uniref:DUF4371 domain-containing protein n=1 Tax=Amphimedon queenslandica TaxID=400682 RepID=A0A1X7UVC4_AMPQE